MASEPRSSAVGRSNRPRWSRPQPPDSFSSAGLGIRESQTRFASRISHLTSSGRLGFVPPSIPTLVSEPPEDDGWIHEIKYDGYRTLLVIEDGIARTFTRNGHDWSNKYARTVEAAAKLKCRSAILDGELVVLRENGISDFSALRRAIGREPHRPVLFAFDLLHLDGEDLRKLPLVERRRRLKKLLGRIRPSGAIQFSDDFRGDAAAFFKAADDMGLEGSVSKRADSRYRSGRCTSWLKTKCVAESNLILLGTEYDSDRVPYALLGRQDEGELVFAGKAIISLPERERLRLKGAASPLAVETAPLRELRRRQAEWVRPGLLLKVRHLKGSDSLRHATVRGIAA